MKKLFILVTSLIFINSLFAQKDPLLTSDVLAQQKWVDSVYNSLNTQQRIGQLFMVDAFSSKGKAEQDRIQKLINEQYIGGIIFSKGGPIRQAKMCNALQNRSKTPLLIAMDAEWGLAMRLDSTYAFPWNMTLGAIQNTNLIKKTGNQIGKHCKRLGVHVNFAPVVDINTNPKNPIIGNRSFGEEKEWVAKQAVALMEGMHEQGILTNAKHFPGHGDTDKDSHKTLPSITFDKIRIENIELFPFEKLIDKGVSSVMIAHLNIPSLIQKKGLPSSLSNQIVTNLLKKQLKFKGLVFTDALNMKGAANFDEPGDIDLAAFEAGNDILLISENIPKAVKKIKAKVLKGEITTERLAYSVKKVLKAKYKAGLHEYSPIKIKNLVADLNNYENELLTAELAENAITVIKNEQHTIPIQHLELRSIAYVPMGEASGDHFVEQLKDYGKIEKVEVKTLEDINKLAYYNQVIIGYHADNTSPWKAYKLSTKEAEFIDIIGQRYNSILVSFAKPYALNNLEALTSVNTIIVGYQNHKAFQEKAAQIIFGGLPSKGVLPVSIAPNYKAGDGFFLNKKQRLGYRLPEQEKLDSKKLRRVDSLVNNAIAKKMTPGVQLLIARNANIVYNKPYGYHTYDKKRKVKKDDLYDLASLTKILATLPLTMKLHDIGQFKLNDKLVDILPEFKETDKDTISILDALSHQAKLKPWIPFYLKTLDSISYKPLKKYYSKTEKDWYTIKIANEMYLREDYPDSIFQEIIHSELRKKKVYKYSDLPFYILKEYIEDFYKLDLAQLTYNQFYNSLGASNMMYNPLKASIPLARIIPTENDSLYRNQIVHGYVHDQGAAMQNGIGGHAGLFANANDVAKMMQLYLNEGIYGGTDYFSEKTFKKFNTCHFCDEGNRRGVGFDKPQLEDVGPTCGCVSMESFGHSGFTGTYTWADPKEKLIYVFLSNRTFPDATNRKLIKEDVRTNIQKLIYEAIIE